MTSRTDYHSLKSDDGDSGDALLTAQQILHEAHMRNKQSLRFLFAGAVLVVIAIIIIITDVTIHLRVYKPSPTMLECAKMTSPYSSIWDAVEFYETDFVNFFNHSTIYRGPPTLEREQAWDDLWNHWGIAVDEAGLTALNKDFGDHTVTVGSDPNHPTYGAGVEAFHQLHCLNKIRQYTWPIDLFDPSWGDVYPSERATNITKDAIAQRMHVDHCIETLRLSLMCYADITPVLVETDKSRSLPFKADFNVHHKCRNFDKIVQYVDSREIDIEYPTKR